MGHMAEETPTRERLEPPRLPKTYTVGHERDANPRVGRMVLVVLAVLCLGLQGAEFLFLPHASIARLLAAAGRVGVSWACVLALAAGLGAARWPLALFHVGLGVWLEVHAMMGTFAAAYPALTHGSSLVPSLLGALFLGAGGWFGLSADLTAYLDRGRPELTTGSRLATAAVLAMALGVPAAGLVFTTALTLASPPAGQAAASATDADDAPAETIPLPPQRDEGARFALELIQRAVQAKDFGVFTAALSPETRARTDPEWTRRVSADLARRGAAEGFRLSDVVFNRSLDERRELTYCNVFAVYPGGQQMCFHCNLSRDADGAKDWQVDMVFIE